MRTYRGLSWRKVLVKLEPDAHNNIIVRRMFANAFGWPVVHHMVEAHFSDSVSARTRDDEESNHERAKGLEKPPNRHGEETKAGAGGDGAYESTDSPSDTGDSAARMKLKVDMRRTDRVRSTERSASEVREAMDAVPELPRTPKVSLEDKKPQQPGSASSSSASSDGANAALLSPRPQVDRLDSATWSDRDWADSGDESDSYGGESRRPSYDTRKESATGVGLGLSVGLSGSAEGGSHAGDNRSDSAHSGTWNWTEKIVGKGTTSRGGTRPPPG